MSTPEQVAAELLVKTKDDPLLFVQSMYPWGEKGTKLEDASGPRDWQVRVMSAIRDHLASDRWDQPCRIGVASGHGIGKSALMAWLAQWGTMTCIDSRGVITANTEGQLRTKTWVESRTWFEMNAAKQFFDMEGMSIRSADASHRMTWRFDAIPWSSSNPEAFAGMHNQGKRIVILFDEASAIDDKIWEVIEGALTDEKTQIIWVVFGNPTRASGRFYQAFHQHRDLWIHESIDSRDVEGTNKQQLDEWGRIYGLDSDFFRVRVRGLFARSGSNQLISTGHCLAAQRRDGDVSPRLNDPLVFGIDVARYGGDPSVLCTRKGDVVGVHGIHEWRGLGAVDLADKIAEQIILLRPHYVFVDGGGVGGGVIDVLHSRGFDVEEVQFGSKSPNPDYANRRAYMWVKMRDYLAGNVSIPWTDTQLFQELTQQTYQVRENKASDLILTSKEAMRRDGLSSPDRADALALTFAYEVNPVVHSRDEHAASAFTADTDYKPGWE